MDALVGRMRQKEHFWNAHLFNTEQGRAGALPGMSLHGTADALAEMLRDLPSLLRPEPPRKYEELVLPPELECCAVRGRGIGRAGWSCTWGGESARRFRKRAVFEMHICT